MEEHGEQAIRMKQLYKEKGDTWPKVLKYNYEKYGDHRRAMRHKHYGVWHPHTWKDYYLNVKQLALGLLAFGLEPGDKVLIIGDNAPQWYYAELAAQANHGVSVGLFSDLLPLEIQYIAENSEARFAVVEGQEQVDKLLQIKDALPLLEKVIFWNYKGLAHYNEDILVGYREALKLGETYEAEHPGRFEQNVETGNAGDICAIIYTAGTTEAAPKGVVHTFRTLQAGSHSLLKLDPGQKMIMLSPICHLSGSMSNGSGSVATCYRPASSTSPRRRKLNSGTVGKPDPALYSTGLGCGKVRPQWCRLGF
jgi:long-chain acyl-CoA synthetase